ncbi:MAG: metallophosphoesterase [Candidatus Aenigmatarchaeota archaeon]
MRFVLGKPALKIGKTLIIADLHLGIELEPREAGIRIPSQRREMAEKIREILNMTGCKDLLILGDLKHKIPGMSKRELAEISRFISDIKCPIRLIPGNHDGGIKRITEQNLEILPTKGIESGDTWFCHGHAKPDKKAWTMKRIVIAHSHPVFEFKDTLGYTWTEPVWVIARQRPEIVIIPAFNHWAGGLAVNKKALLGPVAKRIKSFELYLLDGTLLGRFRPHLQ